MNRDAARVAEAPKSNNGTAAATGNAKCIRPSASVAVWRRWFRSNPAVKNRFIAGTVFNPNGKQIYNGIKALSGVSDGVFLILAAGNPFPGRELNDLDHLLGLKLAIGRRREAEVAFSC
jgi:hypothetical protein